jgi:hypothetical protein
VVQYRKPPIKLEAKHGAWKHQLKIQEQKWKLRVGMRREKNPNEGVRYFAQGAQTLLILVRGGP